MALIHESAIVLRRLDYSETSQVLAVLTHEHGQQRLIAKGIKRSTKKRTAVGIDLLERGRLVYSRRPGREDSLGTLTEWRQQDTFPALRRDLRRWYAAQYAAEVTAALTEIGDPHPNLFVALDACMGGLSAGDPVGVLCGYLWTALREVGLRPGLDRCVACENPIDRDDVLYFSARQGGILCRDCEPSAVEKRRIDPAAAHALVRTAACAASPAAIEGDIAYAAFDLLDYQITETLSRPPRLSSPLRLATGMTNR